jgi:hypothetical protein
MPDGSAFPDKREVPDATIHQENPDRTINVPIPDVSIPKREIPDTTIHIKNPYKNITQIDTPQLTPAPGDKLEPTIYSVWGGDMQMFTGCETAENYKNLVSELSSHEHSTELTTPTAEKGFFTTLRRTLGF